MMINVDIDKKEKIYNDCRIEDVTENTFCLWHEVTLGMPPMCYLEVGEWCWSTDFKKVVTCFKELIAWNFACTVTGNADYASEDKTAIEILNIYANDFDTSIKEAKLTKELITLLKKEISNPNLFEEYLKQVFKCFNSLGVEATYSFCKGIDSCMSVVMEHYGGEMPVYPTIKEHLLEDYLG